MVNWEVVHVVWIRAEKETECANILLKVHANTNDFILGISNAIWDYASWNVFSAHNENNSTAINFLALEIFTESGVQLKLHCLIISVSLTTKSNSPTVANKFADPQTRPFFLNQFHLRKTITDTYGNNSYDQTVCHELDQTSPLYHEQISRYWCACNKVHSRRKQLVSVQLGATHTIQMYTQQQRSQKGAPCIKHYTSCRTFHGNS
jgi:hypothetical protein